MKKLLIHFILNIDKFGLKFIAAFSILSYIIFYFGMYIVEPAIAENFFWYFVVTVTTVGYGDISPTTFGGKFIGIFIIVFGGLFYTMLIAYLYTFFSKIIHKNKRGLMKHTLKEHIVILGYNSQKTEAIIDEIRATKDKEHREILLCTYDQPDIDNNPIEDYTRFFVKGNFKNENKINDTVEKANMQKAYCVIIDLEDDDLSFIAFSDLLRYIDNTYMVVALNDRVHNSFRFRNLHENVHCVNSQEYAQIVTAFQHPGTINLLDNLAHNAFGHKLMRLNLSNKCNMRYLDLFIKLKEHLNIQLVGIAQSRNPNSRINDNPNNDIVLSNKGIFYVGDRAITEKEILELFS